MTKSIGPAAFMTLLLIALMMGANHVAARIAFNHGVDVATVDAGTPIDETYLMALERKHFCSLLEHPKSQERIMGMLSTGKPVRN